MILSPVIVVVIVAVIENLVAGTGTKRFGDKVREFRWGVFLDLGDDEETGDPDDWEGRVGARIGDAEEVVEVVNGEVKSFPKHVQLVGHFCDTVQDNGTHKCDKCCSVEG